MAAGKRDANFIVVGMGVSSVDGVTPVSITVDPDTGRLRVKVAGKTGNNATPDRNVARRDENRVSVMAGENSNNQNIEPFSIETANNGIMMQRT